MILLLAILALAITTATLIAAQVDLAARVRADGVRARLAAESAARAASGSWEAAPVRALGLLNERALAGRLDLPGGATARTTVRRVGLDLFLVIGDGAAGQARARAAMLVRVLSVASLLAPFPAALAADQGTVQGGAHIAVLSAAIPPPAWPALSCDPGAADTLTEVFGDPARPGVLAGGSLTIRSADIGGTPPVATRPPQPAATGLGPLGWDLLARRADRTESGSIALAPAVSGGRCEPAAPGNWGDPRDGTSPCWSYLPLIYAPGDLRILGGRGQGVLVVRGRLIMDAGAEFYGPILAGAVEAATGATVWGAVSATTLDWGGTAHYSPCVLLRALSAAPGLGRPFRAGRRLWARFF